MDKQNTNNNNLGIELNIDIMHILKLLWKRAWLIVLGGLLAALIGFYYASTSIPATYSSYIKAFVNTNSLSLGGSPIKISMSELNTAKSLLSTYREILMTRGTLERVAKKAEVEYTANELMGMISCSDVSDTAIIRVSVTCGNPYEACNIANSIAEVLPERIAEIIDGTSMEVVEAAIPQLNKTGPNITRHTEIGFIIGALIVAGIIVLFDVLDDTIHNEEYVINTYEYPILGKVPDLLNTGNKSYSYYSQKDQRSNK